MFSRSNTRVRRMLAAGAVAASAALVLAGCSGGLASSSDGDSGDGPIKLGMLAPFSGSEAAFGDYMRHGAQLAINEINEAGGLLDGRQLELVYEDDACDGTAAAAAANKVVTAGVVASVGGYCSGATQPTLPIFAAANIPMVIPAANSNALVGKGAYMINGTGAQQAEAAVKYSEKLGATVVAVINDGTDYSRDLAETYVADADAASFSIAFSDQLNPDDRDFAAEVKKVMDSGADLVVWTGYYQAGGLLINQLRQAGYSAPILVGDGSVDAQLAEIAGAGNTEGVYGTFTKTPDMLEGAENWIADYEAVSGGAAPGPYSIQTYDAVRVVAEAIKAAGTTDGEALNEAIGKVKGLELSSGPLEFTSEGTLSGGGFVIVTPGPGGTFILHDDLQG